MELNDREKKVLREMAEGYSYDVIAARLYLARTTVNTTARSLLYKLGAKNPQNAVHKGYQAGYLVRETKNGD